MFDQVSQGLLRDLEHIALGMLGIGLLLNFMWKMGALGGRSVDQSSGDITGEVKPHRGKVRSDLMAPVDLFMGIVILAYYYLMFLPNDVNVSSSNSSEPGVPPLELILGDYLVTFFMLTFALSTIYIGGRRNPSDVFGLARLSILRWLGWVLAASVVATFLVLVVHNALMKYWLLPTFGEMALQEAVQTLLLVNDPLIKTLLIVKACLIAPFFEEVVFRGYLYGAIKRYTGPVFSCVVVGLLFAVVHLNIPAVVPLWLFAVLLTLAYEFSGSLWVPVGMHALFNSINVALMLSGRDLPL